MRGFLHVSIYRVICCLTWINQKDATEMNFYFTILVRQTVIPVSYWSSLRLWISFRGATDINCSLSPLFELIMCNCIIKNAKFMSNYHSINKYQDSSTGLALFQIRVDVNVKSIKSEGEGTLDLSRVYSLTLD